MKEQIFQFVNQYAVWGILLAVLLAFFVLCRMHRQLKKLNRSLSAMTGKMQDYFTAIMEEEPLEPVSISTKEPESTEEPFQRRTAEETGLKQKSKRVEEEAIIHAVLKEYLS